MDYSNINVVKNNIPYTKVIDFVEFVVKNSFGKDGRYHEYLKDYSEAVAIITMYTDCTLDKFMFDDIMDFVCSEKWNKIKDELGDVYVNFHYYVKCEIEYLNTPLRFADDTIKALSSALKNVNNIIQAVDVDALKGYDFTNIINLANAVAEATKNEETNKK